MFFTQDRFIREYIKGGLAKPEDRHATIARLCEQAGGKLVLLYFTLGRYDLIVVQRSDDGWELAQVIIFHPVAIFRF